jgi:hypothetical protein
MSKSDKKQVMWVGHRPPSKEERKLIKQTGNMSAAYNDAYFRGKESCCSKILDTTMDRISRSACKSGANCIVTNLSPKIAKRFIDIELVSDVLLLNEEGNLIQLENKTRLKKPIKQTAEESIDAND